MLLFLLVSVSLFAGRGNRNLDETEFRGRGAYALAEEETSSTQDDAVMGRRMNQVQNTPNIEDCQYLETGERLFLHQEENLQRSSRQQFSNEDGVRKNNQQQLNQQENNKRRNDSQQFNNGQRGQRANSFSPVVR